MSKYKERPIAGNAYVRANQITIINDLEGTPVITFTEEEVMDFGQGKGRSKRPVSNCQESLTPDNATETFNLLDPETGNPTGKTATYGEFSAMLHSLYFHVAGKRDERGRPAPDPEPEPAPE